MKPLLRLLFFLIIFKLGFMQSASAQKFSCGALPIKKLPLTSRPAGAPGPVSVPNFCLNRTITISAFIVLDSMGVANVTEADITAAVNAINPYWSKVCLTFKVCKFTYIKDFTYDTWGQSTNHAEGVKVFHDDPHVINMYFAKKVLDAGKNPVGGYAGPLQPVLIKKGSVGAMSNVMAHELGHFFGLMHTFGNSGASDELVDGSNASTAGDTFKDTEADPDGNGDNDISCHYIGGKKDTNGDFYTPPIGNIMSYYNGCTCGFTNEQLNYMANFYLTFPGMKDLW